MDIIPPALVETGESDAIPEEKTPLQMAQEAHEAASVGWVKRELEQHGKHCPALRNLRSLRAWYLVGAGFIFSASMFGTVTIKSSLKADRLELKDEFREILRAELAKVAINEAPAPQVIATSPVVPPVTPAPVSQPKPRKAASSTATGGGGFHWLNPLNYVQASQ